MNGYATEFDNLLEALRTPPLSTVVRVNSLKTTVDDALKKLQCILDQVCTEFLADQIIIKLCRCQLFQIIFAPPGISLTLALWQGTTVRDNS